MFGLSESGSMRGRGRAENRKLEIQHHSMTPRAARHRGSREAAMKQSNGFLSDSRIRSGANDLASRAVLLYLAVVALGTLVHLYVSVPPTFLSDKRNFFNLIFVKLGWVSTSSF